MSIVTDELKHRVKIVFEVRANNSSFSWTSMMVTWLSAGKRFRGRGAKDNKSLSLNYRLLFLLFFLSFLENFRGAKVV